jgi:hypothetical protein
MKRGFKILQPDKFSLQLPGSLTAQKKVLKRIEDFYHFSATSKQIMSNTFNIRVSQHYKRY